MHPPEACGLNLPDRHLATLRRLLAQHVPWAQVWAYGSRVTGGAHEGSDLDLVLRDTLDPERDIEGWAELVEALQESDLPMLVDIHLWSRLPDSFRRTIEAAHVEIQAGRQTDEGLANHLENGLPHGAV